MFSLSMQNTPKEYKERLSQILEEFLHDRGYIQTDVAAYCNVSNSAVSGWLNKTQFPSEQSRRALAVLMEMSLDTLDRKIQGLKIRGKTILPDELIEMIAQADATLFYGRIVPQVCARIQRDGQEILNPEPEAEPEKTKRSKRTVK